MKKTIIGLAALLGMGCATVAQEIPATQTAASRAPLYSADTPPPSETFSYDTGYRAQSEEIVTMDAHGYTIQCGNMFFMHTENRPQHTIFYSPVTNGGCENMLLINSESGPQRWLDTGCENIVDVYEEFTADNLPFARESPVGEGRTSMYGSHYNMLLVEEVDAIWRARWNIPNRREVIHWWNYDYLGDRQ
ncbi:MAG: hypothetical protein V1734_06700 [Nanoarchaeota archaeon]